jgi:hypothetical protein
VAIFSLVPASYVTTRVFWNLPEDGVALAVTVNCTSDEADGEGEADGDGGDDVCGLDDEPGVVVAPGLIVEGP